MEAMAAESLVASAWELDGFLTKLRWPVRIAESGQCSDIDVVGINASGVVRLAECKVPWGPRHIQVVSGSLADNFGLAEPCNWLATTANIARLWSDPPDWLPRVPDVQRFEFWICANVWFPDEDSHRRANANVYRHVRAACPRGMRSRVSVQIKSTRDILLDVIGRVRTRVRGGHGRRFGHPILDAIRELVRYSNPKPGGGGQVGAKIAEETRMALLNALGFDDCDEGTE